MTYRYDESAGFAYTLATKRLFVPMPVFHAKAEALLGRGIMLHEFTDPGTWDALQAAFEALAMEELSA